MIEPPEPGTRLYSAHLDRWVRWIAPSEPGDRAAVSVEAPDGGHLVTMFVSTTGLFPTEHYPAQIGTHHRDGSRTHAPPGEVCAGCSDQQAGRWVPVNECPQAWEVYSAHHDAHGYGAWLWLS